MYLDCEHDYEYEHARGESTRFEVGSQIVRIVRSLFKHAVKLVLWNRSGASVELASRLSGMSLGGLDA